MLRLDHFPYYYRLMRFDKPIGLLLLLWPTLWALLCASHGRPSAWISFVFIAGVILMRSAGCVMNDIADRQFDRHVARTRERVLAVGHIAVREAFVLAAILAGVAFLLVLTCGRLTILLAFLGALFALVYPFLKRITYWPQAGLGVAFAWGVPMAFAAVQHTVPFKAWLLFLTCALWPVIYDTWYAMVDREDDQKIGVKSTARLFESSNPSRIHFLIALLQGIFVVLLGVVGALFQFNAPFYGSLFLVAALFLYQQWLVRTQHRQAYFAAFMNNQWVGCGVFVGMLVSLL